MIKFMKKLTPLIFALGFILLNCAATMGTPTVPLGGTPRVETIGDTVGMPITQLLQELGTPHKTGRCMALFEDNGESGTLPGQSFQWNYVFINIPDNINRDTTIFVCVVNDIIVGEHREWEHRRGAYIQQGQSDSIDKDLVRRVMNNLQEDPSDYRLPLEYFNNGLEI